MTLTIPLVLFVLAGMLLLELTGCVPPPQPYVPYAPLAHEIGYAPAYPAYTPPPATAPGDTVMHQGQRAWCE